MQLQTCIMLFSIQEPVSGAIWHLLNQYCIEDAIFLAERLHAEVCSEESSFLLATCYFRDGQKIHAMHILEKLKCPDTKCRILLAHCYLEQKEYRRVQHILLGGSEISNHQVPLVYKNDAGIVFWLVGESLRRSNLPDESREFFLLSLRYNPYIWSSLQALCEIGHPIKLEDVYVVNNIPVFCNEASFMAVSRSNHPPCEKMEIQEQQQVQVQARRPKIRVPPIPQPQNSELTRVKRKTNLSKVCMKLTFDYAEKRLPRSISEEAVGSPATPTFGTLPQLTTPNFEQDSGGLERSGNVSWLFRQLKDTHLFSSYKTPSPQPFSRESSLSKAPLIAKKFVSSHKQPPSMIRSLLAPDLDFVSPDPLPPRLSRKRETRYPSLPPDDSEPKSKIQTTRSHLYSRQYQVRETCNPILPQTGAPLLELLSDLSTLPPCPYGVQTSSPLQTLHQNSQRQDSRAQSSEANSLNPYPT